GQTARCLLTASAAGPLRRPRANARRSVAAGWDGVVGTTGAPPAVRDRVPPPYPNGRGVAISLPRDGPESVRIHAPQDCGPPGGVLRYPSTILPDRPDGPTQIPVPAAAFGRRPGGAGRAGLRAGRGPGVVRRPRPDRPPSGP